MNEVGPTALVLGVRNGLSNDIAYLRPEYPAADWRLHPNFGDLANFWLHVHSSLRSEGAEVVRIVDAFRGKSIDHLHLQQAFVPRLNTFLQHLDQHHRIEDHVYFPKFRQLDQRMIAGFDLLESDHEIIHKGLEKTVEHARALLAALSRRAGDEERAADLFAQELELLLNLLQRHLADEEDLVVPALLKHGEQAF